MHLIFNVKNPWSRDDFKNIWSRSGSITKHKFWQIEIYRYSEYLINTEISICWTGTDHAGPRVEFGLFGYVFDISIYDCRHWDYDTNSWAD